MRIGFSFWGFLGPGIVDTPDGGRYWRRAIVDDLARRGHDLVLLQTNRDLKEVGQHYPYRWHYGLPDLDALILEWRWPLPGRNTTRCGEPQHHCDLHRQDEILDHYTRDQRIRTLIWDTDRQLRGGAEIRTLRNVTVFDIAARPQHGSQVLRACMVPDRLLDAVELDQLVHSHRRFSLAYVGNQYDRDGAFEEFLVPVAQRVPHRIAGKWPTHSRWPGLNFTGRCPFEEISAIYRDAVATILIMPERYATVGAVSQRLPEALLQGCLPILPANVGHGVDVVPERLHARDGAHALELVRWLEEIAGTPQHRALLDECLSLLDSFRVSTQVSRLHHALIQ